MLNRLAILAVVYLATLAPSGPHKPGEAHQGEAQQGPAPTITIVDNSTRPTQADTAAQKPPEAHAGIEWSNWALVLVGALTFVAVGIQARESKKATLVMRDSIRLQEIGMSQWVEVANWRNEMLKQTEEYPRKTMRVTVDVVNQTDWPITLNKAIIIFIPLPQRVEFRYTFRAGRETFLAPKSPYRVVVDVDIMEGESERYEAEGLTFSVTGEFLHVGVLKRITEQQFRGMLTCGKNWNSFQPEIHMNPK